MEGISTIFDSKVLGDLKKPQLVEIILELQKEKNSLKTQACDIDGSTDRITEVERSHYLYLQYGRRSTCVLCVRACFACARALRARVLCARECLRVMHCVRACLPACCACVRAVHACVLCMHACCACMHACMACVYVYVYVSQ